MNVGGEARFPERFVVYQPGLFSRLISAGSVASTRMARSPLITADAWGSIEVGDVVHRDVKLWPGGSRGWDWNETQTSHQPGIGLDDVAELVEGGAETVVLSTGRHGRLSVPDDTVAELRHRGIDVEVHRTPDAIERYNSLARDGVAVGALVHTTC